MKRLHQLLLVFAFAIVTVGSKSQSYTVDWHKVSGGGGSSSGGGYSLSGTVGQVDASSYGPSYGGGFSLTGGFWSVYAVQTAGVPNLLIVPNGPNSVKVLWPNTGSYTLQQTANVAAGSGAWTTSGYSITTANGTNSITITPSAGNLFFRLRQ